MTALPEPPPDLDLSPWDHVRRVLVDNYADFDGRAIRADYWWYQLAYIVCLGTAFGLGFALSGGSGAGVAFWLPVVSAVLALIIPSIAVIVRRLHDTGRSGWWYFISLVPYVGGFVLLAFMLVDSDPEPNRWGPSPKYAAERSRQQALLRFQPVDSSIVVPASTPGVPPPPPPTAPNPSRF